MPTFLPVLFVPPCRHCRGTAHLKAVPEWDDAVVCFACLLPLYEHFVSLGFKDGLAWEMALYEFCHAVTLTRAA